MIYSAIHDEDVGDCMELHTFCIVWSEQYFEDKRSQLLVVINDHI